MIAFDGMEHVPARPEGNPAGYDDKTILQEFERCYADSNESVYGIVYWIANYVYIFSNDQKRNVPFVLWDKIERADKYDSQLDALDKFVNKNRVISLKARQVGMTTLCLAYFLYEMIFRPKSYILILSRGETEAKELLKKIKDMYAALPKWMRPQTTTDSLSEWRLKNGSVAMSLSSHKGDSFSATHVMIDEAALLYRSKISLKQVLLNLAPTVGLEGKLFLISKADKNRPISTFNSMYNAAFKGKTEYAASFIPYDVVPGRTKKWYEQQRTLSLEMDGTLDYVYETYPKTPEEALSPKSINKRFLQVWIDRCYEEREPYIEITSEGPVGTKEAKKAWESMGLERELPEIAGLRVYELPTHNDEGDPEIYVVTGDPAEGKSASDDSAMSVMKVRTQEQVAVLNEKIEPSVFAFYLDLMARFYNGASILYELNEHGRAVDLWLKDNSDMQLLKGWAATEKSRKEGWTQNSASKPLAYHHAAKQLKAGAVKFYDEPTKIQMGLIESGSNAAPKDMNDDLATAFVLSLAAIEFCMTVLLFGTVRTRR
jgi:hypothetical protein